MLLVLGLLFVVVPIVEIYFIIQVAHIIGGWETIGLLILESLLGAWLMKRQGIGALNRITQAIEQHRAPGKELVDGFLILLAGVLMITPGFVTDVLGFLLLLPPTRALVRRLLMRRFKQGRYGRVFTMVSGPGRAGTRYVGSFRAGDVQDVQGHDVHGHDADGHDSRDAASNDGPDRPGLRG
ncbi:MAG: FxsA family protein [Actinomycetota bacterium]|nr:FxsA family protein [Actinomycetota bacterium]